MEQVDDYGPESHSTDFEEKTKSTRASGFTSYSLHDYGLRTEIGFGSKDYSGKSIDQHMAEQMNNMRKWHSRIRVASPKERRLSNVLSKINEICSVLSLPKTIVETAAMSYRNFENKSEAKGKSITCIAAATIYLACKRCSVVRSLEEIVKATGTLGNDRTNVKLASKYYRMIVMEIGILTEQQQQEEQLKYFKNIKSNISSTMPPTDRQIAHEKHCFNETTGTRDVHNAPVSPDCNCHPLPFHSQSSVNVSAKPTMGMSSLRSSNLQASYTLPSSPVLSHRPQQTQTQFPLSLAIDHYISKLANTAKIDTKVERLAIDIAHKTSNDLLADGKSPNGLAAAYIYLAAVLLGVNLLQIEISNLAGITEVTIRNRCKDILSSFKITIRVKPA
jgi:transcription initiation factor TFIIB